jgi:hypothetical protein
MNNDAIYEGTNKKEKEEKINDEKKIVEFDKKQEQNDIGVDMPPGENLSPIKEKPEVNNTIILLKEKSEEINKIKEEKKEKEKEKKIVYENEKNKQKNEKEEEIIIKIEEEEPKINQNKEKEQAINNLDIFNSDLFEKMKEKIKNEIFEEIIPKIQSNSESKKKKDEKIEKEKEKDNKNNINENISEENIENESTKKLLGRKRQRTALFEIDNSIEVNYFGKELIEQNNIKGNEKVPLDHQPNIIKNKLMEDSVINISDENSHNNTDNDENDKNNDKKYSKSENSKNEEEAKYDNMENDDNEFNMKNISFY